MLGIKDEYLQELMSKLSATGIFVVSGNNPANVMTSHWGAYGTFWGKPMFVLPVRQSRHSHGLIDAAHEFALSVARKDMSQAIHRCEHVSGRNLDKFAYCHLHPTPCRKINTSYVSDCGLHFECRVVFKTVMEGAQLFDLKIPDRYYKDKNYHTMFFAEILTAYED
ncbi:MAG: flavin reductase [Clostridiales bacterium]|jgi:flavin reductase (DIM6/NTAB) family NADH-FMN oxidoreductase RutF|nr:flavin reductase [Clostridiales bacterium]